ncbi:MAG: class I SAM-dependent methyltransferase [Clostridia bacterium]|nr:class I SAM-dependent methyltransferase [Clostridia bacterium]
MTEHYYTKNPTSEHHERDVKAEIFGMDFIFTTDSGVFSRDGVDPGTRTLIEALPDIEGRALDLGCGWGAAGLPVAKKNPGCTVVMTDINERAAELSRKNAKRNGVKNVEIITGDGLESVTGEFAAIFTNPPIRAGKQKIYEMFAQCRDHLVPGGCLYIVIRKQQGAPSALKYLGETYDSAEVIDRSGGYWVIKAQKA